MHIAIALLVMLTTAAIMPASPGAYLSTNARQSLVTSQSRGASPTHHAHVALTSADVRAMLAGLRLVDYYPANNPWANMWANWTAISPTINADFSLIANVLHGNAVRINTFALTGTVFGFPNPSSSELNALTQTIQMAASNGLKVELDLFNWFSNYSDIADSIT